MALEVRPITRPAVPAVARFLHAHLSSRVSPAAWAGAMDVPWRVDAPNFGFMLVKDAAADEDAPTVEQIAGVYLAIYADRTIDGVTEKTCNLAAWCVLPAHRMHSVRL